MESFTFFSLPIFLLGQAMGTPCRNVSTMGTAKTLSPIAAPTQQKTKSAVSALNFQ
jgi:hypothetical protein